LHYPSGNSPGQNLLEIHAAGFALPARSRADHEIVRPACDRLDELRYEPWNIAAIAIEKQYDVAFWRNRSNACRTCSSITSRRSCDARAGFTRPLRCAICAAVINNDHFLGYAGREAFANHAGDRVLFVQRRDDNRHFAHRKTSHALVK
jgi:hypothetical protein